ncbi:hypothetical protein AVEN_196704-1 [Araneus ventricosus]|uniref:Uncharacterized protein n=1 Tax=Araneus ventricosus TaxID=182803 RepID=A0A4Y2GYF2_ARAVE|nr:hypothetical protein AVEN_196704-1 [Araneus ventricosus]
MSEQPTPFRAPLRQGNKKKSAGARSGEYGGGCSRTVTLRVTRKCLMRIAVCGRALSWSSFHCPLNNYNFGQSLRMRCSSRFKTISLDSALTVVRAGTNS